LRLADVVAGGGGDALEEGVDAISVTAALAAAAIEGVPTEGESGGKTDAPEAVPAAAGACF
jgi:hypothetical protein